MRPGLTAACRGFHFFSSGFLYLSGKLVRKIHIGTLLLISSPRVILLEYSVSFRGFRFFSSLFLIYERFLLLPSRLRISLSRTARIFLLSKSGSRNSSSANRPNWISLSSLNYLFPFEIVPPASSYSVPVISTMRSSFSYQVLPYILIHIFS